jgi:hypothetical protein
MKIPMNNANKNTNEKVCEIVNRKTLDVLEFMKLSKTLFGFSASFIADLFACYITILAFS